MTAVAGDGLVASSGQLELNVPDMATEMTGDVADTDEFAISDGGTMKKVDDGSNIADDSIDSEHIALGALDSEHYASGSIEGGHIGNDQIDSQHYAAGSIDNEHLAADAVDGTKLADDAVDSEHIALGALDSEHYASGSIESGHLAGSVANAKLANDSVTVTAGDGLKGGGEVDLGASVTLNIEPADFAGSGLEDDGSDNLRIAAAAAGDGLTGGAGSALALDIDGMATAMTGDLEDADEFAISDGGTMKKVDFSVVRDAVFADVSGDATVAAGGALTLGADVVDGSNIADDSIDSEHIALGALDAEHYASGSIENGHLAGSIANAKLSNSSVTVTAGDGLKDGGSVALGASVTLNIEPADFAGTGLEDDGSDNLRIAASAAGNGLSGGGGSALALDLNELSAAAVAVAADSIAIIDADDNSSKKESIADLMTAVAGDGLAASSGVLAVGVDDSSIELNSDALRVKAGGITSAMIADGAIVNADVNASAAIEATKLNFNVDLGGNVQFGTQSDDTVAFAGPIKAGANTIADSGNNAAITLDGSGGFGTLGGFGGGSGISFSSGNGAQFATDLTVNKSDGSMANDFKVFGDTAGAYFMYDASADKAIMHNGTDEIMQLGTTTGGYAIEVANLSGDAGKIKASAFVTYSDETLKEEVTAMDNALDAVMSLNGVEFTWKGSGERDFGFLAQEVKSVLPQAVSVGNDGIHGVDYSRLTSVLVEAVKAQQVQIEELKAILKK
jgi:hypothetical protein